MQRIIVGVDGGTPSKGAARAAFEIATATGAALHLVTAVRSNHQHNYQSGGDHWLVTDVEVAESHLRDFAGELGVQITITMAARKGSPAKVLLDEAASISADLIVVGNRRMQGPTRVLGSIGAEILAHAPCNVLIAKTH